MRVQFIRTIRGRIVVACLLLVLAPIAAVWALGWYEAFDVRADEEALTKLAAELGSTPSAAALEATAARERVYLRVLDRDGDVVASTDPAVADGRVIVGSLEPMTDFFYGPEGAPTVRDVEDEAGDLAARPEVVAALAGTPGVARRYASTGGLVVCYRAVPIDEGALVLASGGRRAARSLYDSRYQLLKLTLALCLGAAVLAVWLSWSVVAPIATLRRRIGDHRGGASGRPLELPRDDEIGALAADFEALRERLARQLADTTRSAADLAHELKSPVAAVAAAAELVEQTDTLTEDRRRRIATALADAAARMSNTLDTVLALAELDESLFAAERQPVDLCVLARRVVDTFDDAKPTVELRAPAGGTTVIGVATRLAEALRNLVDNATVFARDNVTIEIATVDDDVVVSVIDDGPGVRAEDRERIFSRFYSARPEGGVGGSGLGLPIARSIAAAHGGRLLLAEPRPVEGARFELHLPAPRA